MPSSSLRIRCHEGECRRDGAQLAKPEVQRLLGKSGEFGKMLGLEPDWAVKVIATTAITPNSTIVT